MTSLSLLTKGLPRWLSVKNLPANPGDARSNPGPRRSPGGGNGNPLQYSCLENLMDRGAWRATVHRVAKSRMRLKQLNFWEILIWVWTSLLQKEESVFPSCDQSLGRGFVTTEFFEGGSA